MGCFLDAPNKHTTIIIDKSTGQENNLPRFPEAVKRFVKKPLKTLLTQQKEFVPVNAKLIKTFSKKHPGLTFNTHPNQTVRAIRNGVVVYSGEKTAIYGKMIIIKHPLGFYSSYAHNQTLKVQNGDKIKKRQIIAVTGTDNFYFAMKKFETPIDPLKYLK